MRNPFVYIFFMLFSIHACTSGNASDTTDTPLRSSFPFEINDAEGGFSISASIESKALFEKYNPIFTKNGYSGNGYSWEGHIIQILEKLNPNLLAHINFDSEAGSFFAYANTKQAQMQFVETLAPVFFDLSKLETYIKVANRKRIDD